MNILYMINHAGKGGSEKYIKNLANFAVNNGDTVFFCYNEKGFLAEQMEEYSKLIMCVEMKGIFDLKAAKSVAEFCNKNSIDIIHTQFARENYIAIMSKYFGGRAKVIHTCHINTENNRAWRILNKVFMGNNQKVIAVCNSVKDLLIKNNYPKDKVEVIFNGIEYRESIEKSNIIREELGISENAFIFISLARFSEEKGIFFMLEACRRLKEDDANINFALVIAGDGPLFEKAKTYIKENGLEEQVFLPGYRTDSDKLLLSADCFINASSSEALSFAILEAMEAGLPVIATDVGGNPDIINKDTKCGYLVPYGNVEALSDIMHSLSGHTEMLNNMASSGREAVKNIFNVKNSLEKTYGIYKEVINAD